MEKMSFKFCIEKVGLKEKNEGGGNRTPSPEGCQKGAFPLCHFATTYLVFSELFIEFNIRTCHFL